jgi:hypothetical protein
MQANLLKNIPYPNCVINCVLTAMLLGPMRGYQSRVMFIGALSIAN